MKDDFDERLITTLLSFFPSLFLVFQHILSLLAERSKFCELRANLAMSNDLNDPRSIASQLLVHSYLHMLGISILYWDHALTFKYEIHHLWTGPKTWSSYWFFLNRYFAFFANITVTIFEFVNLPPLSCKRYGVYRQMVLFIQQVIVCVLLTMRIYALYGRSIRILGYMLGSAFTLAVVAAWSLFGQKGTTASSGCHIGIDFITSVHLASAWEALFCYDSILFGFTLYQTYKSRHGIGMSHHIPLVSLMLRDGAIYFAVMALANLSNILTFYLAGPFLRGSLSTFASCMSVTMMSRLMLNLHSSARSGIFSTLPTFSLNDESNSVELDTLRTEDLLNGRTTMYMFTSDHHTRS
ncbi:hypothetical protein F5878DRAFT_613746 [Lentinula raphanica]|uniref:DUF6533 domain-containing protein n=1 Tax=Lentinula raphanica TaxID=153919 RepID=A0AA38PCK4_9AGAR|nr:hypothetical protein F5878DRAFT_613746 [Lentinula raphanica]